MEFLIAAQWQPPGVDSSFVEQKVKQMSAKTIAIIGATGTKASAFSKRLAATRHRLLLFDRNLEKLASLVSEIKRKYPFSNIEFMGCEGEASWEADIIIADVFRGQEKELSQKITPFANRKIVLHLSDSSRNDLQALLPGASVIGISNVAEKEGANDQKVLEVFAGTSNGEVVKSAVEIIEQAGYVPLIVNNNNKKQIFQSKVNTMETTKWIIDPTHSELHFRVRHLMVSWVSGSFKKFDATVQTEGENISTAKVRFTADINSISTNNEQRDAHLRTADFFDATSHPQIIFESDKLEKIDDENYKLYGTLTIRGNSRKIALNVEYGGVTKDPWGNTRTGFSVSGRINRKDFGVSFSMVSETGGILLGEEVSISANVEFVKEAHLQTKAA